MKLKVMGSNPGYLFKSFLLYVNFLVKSWQYSFKFLYFNEFFLIRSIKSAIRELSTTGNNTTGNGNGIPDDETSHNNITEEIAAELTVCKFSRQIMTVYTVILKYFNIKE